ncbi:MAG: glutathione S-transferase [Gammaproteobacteria bacterium]|nr:glutathione S-transferase [Gammaproteobacteria bacterium]
MKFYDCKTAPNPRRVRMFFAEKGLEVPTEQVDLRGGEHLRDEFKAKNPDCTVPMLELDDGTCISESMAICRYFEEVNPEPPLFGSTPTEKAQVEMWNRRFEHDGLFACAEAFRNSTPGFKSRAIPGPINFEQIPELAERGKARTQHFLEVLNDRLGESKFVAGDKFSVADITTLVSVDFAGWLKFKPQEEHVHLKRWYEEVSNRPSASA